MGRVSTSALLLLAAALSLAQPVGRFGFDPLPSPPGFKLSAEGFRSSSSGADTFYFKSPLEGFKATQVSDRSALFQGGQVAGLPQKIRVNLRSPGFEMHFPGGFEFRFNSLLSPYLSWSEGSVGEDVPTPKSSWILVSFRDKQPPVLLIFEDTPADLMIQGTSKEWVLTSLEPYSGWIRVCLPLGQYTKQRLTAHSLGEMVKEVEQNIDLWSSEAPSLVNFQIRTDDESLTAVWTFDKPGALVPPAAMMSRTGGYPIQILTGIKQTGADLWDGPTVFTTEPKFAVKFPYRRVPSGRSITVGAKPKDTIATASPFDVPSLCDLALANLTAGRDKLVADGSDVVTSQFLEMASYTSEPNTRQKFPFTATGAGIDLAAAHALVVQSSLTASGMDRVSNRLFTEVSYHRDWYSWLVWADDQKVARRASAVMAVAGALSSDKNKQLEACMLQAGLAAERALSLYRSRRDFPEVRNDLIEPLFPVRMGLFRTGPSPFVNSLMSEVRTVSATSVVAEWRENGVLLKWDQPVDGPGEMRFLIGRPVTAIGIGNVKDVRAEQSLGTLRIRYSATKAGECSVLLQSPGWANPLPATYSPPRYSESG